MIRYPRVIGEILRFSTLTDTSSIRVRIRVRVRVRVRVRLLSPLLLQLGFDSEVRLG